jgi:hypothetical protein
LNAYARAAVRAAVAAFLAALLLGATPALAADVGITLSATRTDAEVRALWSQLKPTYSGTPYVVTPSIKAPYAPGSVNAGFLSDGLGIINFARFLAGLPNDVTLDSNRNTDGQYAAVLLAAGTFSHEPPKPADMTQAFYDRAVATTTSSNLGYGYADSETFQLDCLSDDDAGNIPRLGHRRWLLNPQMLESGIGFAESRHATYAFDRSRTEQLTYSAIAYPSAGPFPVDGGFLCSTTPWSITLNPLRYDWDTTGHTVTLRRVSDGKTWTFTASDTNTSGEYFATNFSGYGVPNVFIFRPDPQSVTYAAGDQFDVTLSGGIYAEGTRTPATITYRTRFISLDGVSDPTTESIVENGAAGVVFDRWVSGYSAAYSGGSYVYGRWSNTQLEATLTGSKIRWIGPKQPFYGMADVYVDGVKAATVDCYAAPSDATLSATIWESPSLPDGPHTIAIRLVGQKNAASSDYVVVLDRFEVDGIGPACAGTRLDEAGAHATMIGTWVDAHNPTYFDEAYVYSRWVGAVYRAGFTGTKIAWIGPKTGAYGCADVYIDGQLQGTVDQYSAVVGWRSRVWESGTLAPGSHTIEIRPTGAKRAAATSTNIVIDALDVTP